MPVGRLLATMSIPAITSMMIQALYNVVDTFFVSLLDPDDNIMITAVGYALPIQIILLAFALGIGIGTNVLVARKLGESNKKEASNIARTGLFMAIISGIIFFILSLFLTKPFMHLMSNIPDIIHYGSQYLHIIMMFSIFMFVEIVCNKILQGQGRMIVPMITQIIGAVINIILDPIFIFGLFGIPAMGIKGAAIATIIGQLCAMIFVITYIFTHKIEISLKIKKLNIKREHVLEIIKVGAPAMLMNSVSSVTNILLNNILKNIDPQERANTILTLYFKMQNFIFMPVFGLNQGGLPILAYNYGAINKKRYLKTLKLLIISAFVIMLIGFMLFQFIPNILLQFFTKNTATIQIGVAAFRIISISFLPAAFGIIITNAYQSLSYGHFALIMSILRQVLLLIPCALLLGKLFGLDYIWFAFPISETIVALIFFPYILKLINHVFTKKEINKKLKESVG